MGTNKFVEIDLPDETDLADLTGICLDLESVRRFAEQLKDMLSGEEPDSTLVEPMTVATIQSQPSKHGAQVHTHRPSQRSRAFSCLHTRDGALSHLLQSLVIQSSPISIHGVDSIARRRSVTYATRSGSGRASASNCMCMKACASWLKRSDSSAPPSRGSVSTESPP